MQIYTLIRGIKHDVDRFINELSAKYLPFKFRGEDKMIQVSVRPIQLFEIGFPKEHLDVILSTLTQNKKGYKIMMEKKYSKLKKYAYLLRRILNLSPVEIDEKEGEKLTVYCQNLECIIIGVKEDETLPDGTEGI